MDLLFSFFTAFLPGLVIDTFSFPVRPLMTLRWLLFTAGPSSSIEIWWTSSVVGSVSAMISFVAVAVPLGLLFHYFSPALPQFFFRALCGSNLVERRRLALLELSPCQRISYHQNLPVIDQ